MIQTVVPVFCEGFGNYFWQWVYVQRFDASVALAAVDGIALPRFKGDHRKDRQPYEEFLSNETIELIGTINQRAIELLGFKPRASMLEAGSQAVKVG